MLSLAMERHIPKDNVYDHFLDTYLMILGEFVNMVDSDVAWIIFILLTVTNTIMLLNLIISVISDTFDRV